MMTHTQEDTRKMQRYYRDVRGYHRLIEERRCDSYVVPPGLLLGCIDRNGLIVDIAGGSGINAQILELNPLKYVCVDFSLHGLSILAEKRRGMSLQADAGELPIKHDSVDVVICSWSLEHMTTPSSVLDEMIRIVRPGGRILIWGPNWDNILRKDFPQFAHKDRKYIRRVRREIFFRMFRNEFLPFRYDPYINLEVAALADPDRYISGDTDAIHCVLCQETCKFLIGKGMHLIHIADFSEMGKHLRNDPVTRAVRGVLRRFLPLLRRIPLVRWFVIRFPIVVEKPVLNS